MGRGEAIRAIAAAVLLLLLTVIPGRGAERFPDPVGYVNDFAGVLSSQEQASLARYLEAVERRSGIEMVVVTLPTLGEYTVDDAANRLYEQWGIGKKGSDRGILLLDGIAERKVRIEVGYGLEGALPDGKVGSIIRDYALPLLQEGRRGAAYVAALRVVTRIAFEEIGLEPSLADSLAGGAGSHRVSRHSRKQNGLWPIAFIGILFLLRILMGGGRRGGFYGGMPGSFGGFGGFGGGSGGFGGFGGGASGGGGASSSY